MSCIQPLYNYIQQILCLVKLLTMITSSPKDTPLSMATLLANEIAATLLGCVHAMLPW